MLSQGALLGAGCFMGFLQGSYGLDVGLVGSLQQLSFICSILDLVPYQPVVVDNRRPPMGG